MRSDRQTDRQAGRNTAHRSRGEVTISIIYCGPIYKMSYDLSEDNLKFIVRLTYDSDLERG